MVLLDRLHLLDQLHQRLPAVLLDRVGPSVLAVLLLPLHPLLQADQSVRPVPTHLEVLQSLAAPHRLEDLRDPFHPSVPRDQ